MLPILSIPRVAIPIWLAACLAGCASSAPRYQTDHRHEPPTSASGRACLGKCEQKLAQCQQGCASNYQTCLQRIAPQAEQRYDESLKRYQTELDLYRRELGRLRLYQSFSWWGSSWYGPGYGFGPRYGYGLGYWPDPYYWQPAPPSKPDRGEEFDRLRREQCEADCGCQPAQDACFLACGGKITVQERCFVNCPAESPARWPVQ